MNTDVVTRRRLNWFGHVIRMPAYRLPNLVYYNDFHTPRQRGRPPLRWKVQIQNDPNIPLHEAEHLAKIEMNGDGFPRRPRDTQS